MASCCSSGVNISSFWGIVVVKRSNNRALQNFLARSSDFGFFPFVFFPDIFLLPPPNISNLLLYSCFLFPRFDFVFVLARWNKRFGQIIIHGWEAHSLWLWMGLNWKNTVGIHPDQYFQLKNPLWISLFYHTSLIHTCRKYQNWLSPLSCLSADLGGEW